MAAHSDNSKVWRLKNYDRAVTGLGNDRVWQENAFAIPSTFG